MNAYFGDNRIALEPIPHDATAVVVRVETWEKMESALATLRAENEQLRVQLAGCATAAQGWIDDPAKPSDYGWSPAYQDVLNLRLRARAMERLLLAYKRRDEFPPGRNTPNSITLAIEAGQEFLDAFAAYEQLVKEKP